MTSMVEKVARALSLAQTQTETMWQAFLPEASAAIGAMREPTGAMTAAGIKRSVAWEYGDRGDPDEPPHVGEVATYTAMIDAALAEETKP